MRQTGKHFIGPRVLRKIVNTVLPYANTHPLRVTQMKEKSSRERNKESICDPLPFSGKLACIALLFFLGIFAASLPACAQSPDADASIPASLQAIPPRNWVVDAAAKELDTIHDRSSYLRYHMHIVDAKGEKIRDIIQSRDGSVARLILLDGKPLTEEQDKAERQRLDDMLKDPEGFRKHVKNNESGMKIADSLVRLMPDSMLYTYVPGQPQTGRNPSRREIVLDYEPNPKFHPPSTTAEALTGLRGRAWIDEQSKQVVRMEGHIFRGVNFGWGMLAHIYPGGHLIFDQADPGNGHWFFVRFSERITIRALMVKTINIKMDSDASNFQIMPAMSYQDAIHLLLATPLPKQ